MEYNCSECRADLDLYFKAEAPMEVRRAAYFRAEEHIWSPQPLAGKIVACMPCRKYHEEAKARSHVPRVSEK
jgi:hypothetical protein